jgi:hypothetical protein
MAAEAREAYEWADAACFAATARVLFMDAGMFDDSAECANMERAYRMHARHAAANE